MIRALSRLAALTVVIQSCAFAGTDLSKAVTTETPPVAPTSFCDSTALSQYLFGSDNVWDRTYDAIEKWKKDNNIPLTIGANHWFHVDRTHIYGNGYGVPTERGTYYYYADLDPKFVIGTDTFIQEFGGHIEGRIRDSEDKLRAFYPSTAWFYEAYGYVKGNWGTLKGGKIATQFGIPWDGTWWEGVPYFDGYKFDPDWGLSYEKKFKVNEGFAIDTYAQFFIRSDSVNGSEPGADAESAKGLHEKNTGVLRVVPTWTLGKDVTLSWGISGLVGGIANADPYPGLIDNHRAAWGTDLTLTTKHWNVFGEFIQGFGATNPVNYVSGGPSDKNTMARGGIAYTCGPVTYHANYSYGWYDHPDGHQFVFDPGVSVQLFKNVTLYAEYVKWPLTNAQGVKTYYDDGFELILVWKL